MQTVFVCIFVGTGVLDCPHNHEFALYTLRHPYPPHYDFRAFFFRTVEDACPYKHIFYKKNTRSRGDCVCED